MGCLWSLNVKTVVDGRFSGFEQAIQECCGRELLVQQEIGDVWKG